MTVGKGCYRSANKNNMISRPLTKYYIIGTYFLLLHVVVED